MTGLPSDPADKTQLNGSAVPAESEAVDPELIKPFELGFLREIVFRAVQGASRKPFDVYYHTPDGRKVRSKPEVAEYLGRNPKLLLTTDNFNFARMNIYHPPQEVVRHVTRRWNNNGTTPAQAPRTPRSASARTPLVGSTAEEPAADAPALSCANGNEGLSVRRSTRKQCPCCTETVGSRKRRRRIDPPNATAQAKRGRKSVGPGSQPTKGQPTRAKPLRGRPPSNGRPATFRGSALPPKRRRAQSLGRFPKLTADLPEAAEPTGGREPDVSEREKRALTRRSLPCNSPCMFDELSEDSGDESSSSDDDRASLESSPKRAFVLLQDVLREDKTSPKADKDSPVGRPSSGGPGSVAPIALRAHVAPWKNSVSWEIYELLKERELNAGDAVPDGEEGETAAPKPASGKTTLPRPLRQGKTGCEDEEQCAADLLNGGPTIVEDSTKALEVVLEDAEAGTSTALQRSRTQRSPTRSPATTQRSRRRTPAPIAPKGSLASAGGGAPSVLCSISCPQALGQTPQLVCTRCLCHFHPVCMGLEDIHPHVTGGQFVCKPCSKVSYHRKGSASKSSTQPPRAGSAVSGANPSQVQGPSAAFVVSTVASTTAVPPSTPRASFVTSVSGVLGGAGSSPGTVSMPVLQLVTTPAGQLRFVCVASDPQPAQPSLLPPTLTVAAPSPTLPVQVNTQPLRMPTLMAAPPPLGPVTAVIRSPGVPTVRLQSAPSANATQYYAIHLNHRLSDIDMASLSSLMHQAALKGPAELQRVCNGQGVVLQKGPSVQRACAPQLSLPAGPSSSSPQLAAPPQPVAAVSQTLVTTQLTSAAAPQPASANSSVLKKAKVSSKSSTASAASVPTSAASVSVQKPVSGNALPVVQGQALASGAGADSQPAVSVSACAEAALKVPEGKPKTTDQTDGPGTRDRAILPKQPGGMQAVPGSEPSNTADIIVTSEADCVVRAAATTAPQETVTTASVPRPGEHPEEAAEDRRDTATPMATFCKIENVVSMAAAADNEWPPASDTSEGEGRLVIVEGEGAEDSSNHNHVDESSSETKKETTTTLVSTQVKRPSEPPLSEPPVPPTPPSDSNHSAEATESSASEQGPNDTGASSPASARGPRKAARVKRVKRRKPPLDASASPSTSFPIWIRTQRQMAFVRDRSSPVDPLALHRDVVPNSARAFANADCAMMSLNSVFSWLPLPSLCSAAQVCKSWNIAANSPFLWKRIDFRQFRVKDWDACVLKMRFRGPEELILDGESLDHLLPHAGHLDTVERVSLEVNPRQLACVSRAFPALRSLRALVVRKGSAAAVAANQNGGGEGGVGVAGGEPLRQASLGCLTELLCIRGLERLELSGAHGLALLPLTMAPSSLAQRCQQLRSLSLTTVQQLSPVVVFPISLLEQLEELRLGNCTNWSTASFVNLCQLRELRRLTLERGEDGPGFHTMLLKLNRLESLELKRWTLRDSLCDVLPRMKRLRSLLLWPHINSLASKTHRNTLRSCLSAGDALERFTWIVGCKQLVKGGGSDANKVLSLSVVQHVAPDLRLAFEPGTLCGCQDTADPVLASFASSREAVETSTCASPDTKGRQSTSNAGAGNGTSAKASSHTSPRKTAKAPASKPEAPCCPLAQKISEVWKPSSEETWHMTLRQLRDGLQCLMVPHTAVCVCLHVES